MNTSPDRSPSGLVDDAAAWDPLRDALRALVTQHDGRLKYVPNVGNSGDALIGAGTWQFFDDMGLNPPYVRMGEIRRGDVAIYSGGGNLVNEYESCARFLEHCLAVGVAGALVLPHTISGHEDLLKRLDGRFTLVCRETASLLRVRACGTGARVLYAPDMAFYIDVPRLFARCATYRGAGFWLRHLHLDRLLPYLRWRWALKRCLSQATGHVSILRVDVEATSAAPGDPRWDVSNLYASAFRFREESELVARDFLAFFEEVSSVRTNRLHAGVAGALMGCKVTYLDNSYGKISAVYDSWLSHLPSVSFEQAQPAAPRRASA
ncbi:MAG TPA: polysaccharide pyruvyl transferase family protein [Rhizobacter sp.]|nr:polysaccharide pyruvyl transferase family protein [Rhizobacter sp.]